MLPLASILRANSNILAASLRVAHRGAASRHPSLPYPDLTPVLFATLRVFVGFPASDPAPATRTATDKLRREGCGGRDYQSTSFISMTKPIQEKAQAEVQEPHKLNMEEKRKLEKLLIADIDSATARYDAVTNEERTALIEKLERTPCAEAKRLYERYQTSTVERPLRRSQDCATPERFQARLSQTDRARERLLNSLSQPPARRMVKMLVVPQLCVVGEFDRASVDVHHGRQPLRPCLKRVQLRS